jgi:arginyl-tRNA synthetase
MTASSRDTPLDTLREVLLDAAGALNGGGSGEALEALTVERPKRAEFGDYSTNAAMLLARHLGRPPREIADQLGAEVSSRMGADLDRFEVAGPGFLNLFLGDAWLFSALACVLAAGADFGAGRAQGRERVNLEFVSANPTGPLHVGHARNAAYGDSLARILSLHGDDVSREFYVNDAGTQVRKLGETVLALARAEPVPEDGYHGSYVERLVPLVPREEADGAAADPVDIGRAAVDELLAEARDSLERFRVLPFDHWAFETKLYEGHPSPVARALALLEEAGRTYSNEGALWLRTSELGDDKDRVLIRSDGEPTYFASDVAYQQDKLARGFQRQLLVLGADHHGYVRRMEAVYGAFGGDPEHLELLTMQLVHLVSSGERSQMSKRAGEFVTLDDLVAEIGVDAARWFLLARSHDTTIDLDLDLARSQSAENPVYYVQYAHARIASMLGRLDDERRHEALATVAAGGPLSEPLHPSERALIEQLLAFPFELAEAAAPRTASRRTRSRWPRTSRPSTTTAASSARNRRRSRACASPSPRRRSGRSRARCCCSASARLRSCERQSKRAMSASSRAASAGSRRDRASPAGARAPARRRQRGRSTATSALSASTTAAGTTYTVRSNPCACGRPSTVGPYWATSAFLIWASSLPPAMSARMNWRSRLACVDSATFSGILQVTHIT